MSNSNSLELARALSAVKHALQEVDPDNPVATMRAVAAVARQTRLPTATSWEAFRRAVEKMVAPYFEARNLPPAMAATWAVVDPYFGQLGDGPAELKNRVSTTSRESRTGNVTVAAGAR